MNLEYYRNKSNELKRVKAELAALRARIDGAGTVHIIQESSSFLIQFDPENNKGKWIHHLGQFMDMRSGEIRQFKLMELKRERKE